VPPPRASVDAGCAPHLVEGLGVVWGREEGRGGGARVPEGHAKDGDHIRRVRDREHLVLLALIIGGERPGCFHLSFCSH